MTQIEINALIDENDFLRARLKEVMAKAKALCDAVDKYSRREVSRSMLLHIKDDLDKTNNPKTIKA